MSGEEYLSQTLFGQDRGAQLPDRGFATQTKSIHKIGAGNSLKVLETSGRGAEELFLRTDNQEHPVKTVSNQLRFRQTQTLGSGIAQGRH